MDVQNFNNFEHQHLNTTRNVLDTSKIVLTPTKVYYLKMDKRPAEKVVQRNDVSFNTLKKPIDVEDYLKYYYSVGAEFNWLDRLVMPREELSARINAENVHIHILSINGIDAGFLELVQETDHVELLYFGLFPEFIGRGLGKYFLDWSIRRAWSYGPKWIQLNTCEHDHANALPTYRKLGFVDIKSTVEQRRVLLKH